MPSPLPGRSPWARRCAGVLLVLLAPVPLAACQSASEPASVPDRLSRNDDSVSLASHRVPTRARIHRVYGRLPDPRRKAVRTQVGRVVDRWWDASYLGGTYPRAAFPSAFPGFTDGAEERARGDKALLTNQTRAPYVDSVTARRKEVSLDILATGRRAQSVTAHFVLRFDSTGTRAATTTVRGRLFLTRKRGAWRIFGYDVAKGSK